MIEAITRENVVDTGALRDEPATQSAEVFFRKIKTIKDQQELLKREKSMDTSTGDKIESPVKSPRPSLPNLSRLIKFTDTIVYGELLLQDNINKKKQLSEQNTVIFRVRKVIKGDEKDTLIELCDILPYPGYPVDWHFGDIKYGHYILFLDRGPWDVCYSISDLNSKVEVINTKKTVNTKLITGEPERQSLQEFLKKIETEINNQ
jgi:hypothetical protein